MITNQQDKKKLIACELKTGDGPTLKFVKQTIRQVAEE